MRTTRASRRGSATTRSWRRDPRRCAPPTSTCCSRLWARPHIRTSTKAKHTRGVTPSDSRRSTRRRDEFEQIGVATHGDTFTWWAFTESTDLPTRRVDAQSSPRWKTWSGPLLLVEGALREHEPQHDDRNRPVAAYERQPPRSGSHAGDRPHRIAGRRDPVAVLACSRAENHGFVRPGTVLRRPGKRRPTRRRVDSGPDRLLAVLQACVGIAPGPLAGRRRVAPRARGFGPRASRLVTASRISPRTSSPSLTGWRSTGRSSWAIRGRASSRGRALDTPERVVGLFLEASPLTLRGDEGLHDFVSSTVSPLTSPVDRESPRSFLTLTSTENLAPALLEDLVEDLAKVPVQAWKEMFKSLLEYDDTPELARIGVPVALAWGDEDQLVSRQMQDELLERLPRAELTVYEGSGHTPRGGRPRVVSPRHLADFSSPAAR